MSKFSCSARSKSSLSLFTLDTTSFVCFTKKTPSRVHESFIFFARLHTRPCLAHPALLAVKSSLMYTSLYLSFKSLSQRKSCKIQILVHKQGWPILIIFGGLEGLSSSIPNILYFLSEIQNGRRTGPHLDFPILGQKCH